MITNLIKELWKADISLLQIIQCIDNLSKYFFIIMSGLANYYNGLSISALTRSFMTFVSATSIGHM